MLSGPQRKFVEGIVSGKDQTKAYREAYPNCSEASARSKASRLVTKGNVMESIENLRLEAQRGAGGAVMESAEKRSLLAEMARNEEAQYKDRIAAIRADNELAPDANSGGIVITIRRSSDD